MSETILLVGHGSRNVEGNREIEVFAEQWRQRQPQWCIEVGFIEFADVLLDGGLDRTASNASRVIVVPLILNAAGHVKMEIPEHIAQARLRHPQAEFVYVPNLGADDRLLKILKRNLRKAMGALDMPDPKTTGVIVLGRGSSDRGANGEVSKLARWLFEETDHELVDIAFTGITYPRLEAVVQRQVKLGMMQIVVLPYYLFTGTLIERIRRQVEHLRMQYPQVCFSLSDYFGFEEEIFQLLDERVLAVQSGSTQMGMMPCDGCKYREFAEEHGHHHSHD
ncbi:sirohydrochlorin cobaltochelatase [mine drainage metagenome]|uniref:Sirohydrochlorin cobaltochelatase n=1 Tax=mine drainage metagenome TaxID=410659 RepID=A0A1J5SCL5_9ZZZZ